MKKPLHFLSTTGVITAASGISDWHLMVAGMGILVMAVLLIIFREDIEVFLDGFWVRRP